MAEGFNIYDAMRKKYPMDAYSLLFEVRNATGWKGDRSADAVVLSLWPSRGHDLSGFEFKASRNDWLTELRNPEKAEAVSKFCDFWWIVTTDKGIVKKAELPSTWGLMVPNGKGGLKVQVQAPRLETAQLTKPFIASLFREVQRPEKDYLKHQIEKEVQRRVEVEKKFRPQILS